MSDIEKKPSLRISPYVFGRVQVKNRVTYLIDSKGEGTATGTPERVVLTRWRQRKFPDHSFSGEKLSSTLWRAVAMAYGKKADKICKMSFVGGLVLTDISSGYVSDVVSSVSIFQTKFRSL